MASLEDAEPLRGPASAGLARVPAAGLERDQVDLFACHQANRRILRAVGEKPGLDEDCRRGLP